MSDSENEAREKNGGWQDAEAAHPFDQTNGIVEGLDGDADSPEHADKKTESGNGTAFVAAPAPGTQMPAGIIPLGTEQDSSPETADPDAPTP